MQTIWEVLEYFIEVSQSSAYRLNEIYLSEMMLIRPYLLDKLDLVYTIEVAEHITEDQHKNLIEFLNSITGKYANGHISPKKIEQ